jgi:hypothetical protein
MREELKVLGTWGNLVFVILEGNPFQTASDKCAMVKEKETWHVFGKEMA